MLSTVKSCKLILANIAPRFDLSPYSSENIAIRNINSQLKNLVTGKKHVKILDLEKKSRRLFTRHGLHFNYSGKINVSRQIVSLVKEGSLQEPITGGWVVAAGVSIDQPSTSGTCNTSLTHGMKPLPYKPTPNAQDDLSYTRSASTPIQSLDSSQLQHPSDISSFSNKPCKVKDSFLV